MSGGATTALSDAVGEPVPGLKLQHLILWLGLALCVAAGWSLAPQIPSQIARVGGLTWSGWVVLLLLIWLLSIAAWRTMIISCFARRLSWKAAACQSGMLLVGKYVPGGFFGLAARVLEHAEGESRYEHVAAGLVEQLAGLLITSMTGGVFLLAAVAGLPWLMLMFLVPLLAWLALRAVMQVVTGLRWERIARSAASMLAARMNWRAVLLSLCYAQASVLGWMGLVVWIASVVFEQPLHAALGLAGSFGIAVVAGVVVMIAPGGIGVRESAFVGLASVWLSLPLAIALAAMLRLMSVALDAFAGGVAFLLNGRVRDDRARAEQKGTSG